VKESLVSFLLYAAGDEDFASWLRKLLGREDAAPPIRWLEQAYHPGSPAAGPAPPAASYDVLLAVLSDNSGDGAELAEAALGARRADKTVILLPVDGARPPAALEDLPSVGFADDWRAGLPELGARLEVIARAAPRPTRPATVLTSMPHVLGNDRFHDRDVQMQQVTEELYSDPVGVFVLSGPEGVGKTALVARILDAARTGRAWPRWLIYLLADGSAQVSAAALLTLLGRVAAEDAGADFRQLILDPELTPSDKLRALLQALGDARVLVVLDNLEGLLDDDDEFLDAELGELLEMLAGATQHRQVKALLITRREPRRLRRTGAVKAFPLDDGLESPYAEEFLEKLDWDGSLRLKGAGAVLGTIGELTDGNPRALEAFYSVLERGDASRDELLVELEGRPGPPQERTRYLVGRMFDGLASSEQRLLQALAVFGRPVTSDAVDYLLEPYIRPYQSARELRQLEGRRLIRAGDDGYHLPLVDRERVLAGVERGRAEDRAAPVPPWTQLALFSRAAEYVARRAEEREEVSGLEDLTLRLMEVDLRIAGEEYDEALWLLHEIDLTHLRQWGYSQLLIPQRRRLLGNVADRQAELANLDALGNATQQRDDLEEAKGYLSRAVDLARELGDPDDLASAYIDLGDAYLTDSEPSRALTRFETALELATEHGLKVAEAYARANLSICYGQIGRLDEALEQHGQTLAGIEQARQEDGAEVDQEMAELEAQVLLSIGELLGRRGEPGEAQSYLNRGYRLARDLGHELLVGELLSASAEVELDRGDIRRAVELAGAAVETGTPRRNPRLLQTAYSILALAKLSDGDLPGAQAAASAAARYPRQRARLEPAVLRGIVGLCGGDRGRAREAFEWVDLRAGRLRQRDPANVTVLDPHGLALCGLALYGVSGSADKAAAAFHEARERGSSQAGVADRTRRLLDELAKSDPNGLLGPAREAAAAR
jgi:tetratricopeptide (TPR) repeat protein